MEKTVCKVCKNIIKVSNREKRRKGLPKRCNRCGRAIVFNSEIVEMYEAMTGFGRRII